MNPHDLALTGASGTIGRHIAGQPLRSRLEAPTDDKCAELLALPQQPRALLHLAGRSDVKLCEQSPEATWRDNVDGACSWLLAAHKAGIGRFVFVSSAHVFVPSTKARLLTAATAPDARSVYGKSKYAAELRLQTLASALGMQLAIVRVFSVFSLDMAPHYLGAALVRRAQLRDFSPLPGHHHTRDFSSAQAVASVFARLCVSDDAQLFDATPLHWCSQQPMTVGDLARRVFAHFHVAIPSDAPLFAPEQAPATSLVGACSPSLLALAQAHPILNMELL